MENNEAPFEVEARDEALVFEEGAAESTTLLSASPLSDRCDVDTGDEEHDGTEDAPLLSGDSASAGGSPRGHIDVPWKSGFEGLPWYKQPSIFWLLPAFLPFTLAFGGLIVPKVNLILNLICHDYLSERATQEPNFTFVPVMFGAENPQCRIPEVQSRVAQFQLYLNLVSGLLSALIAPHLGALSDRIGRKKVITVAGIGFFLNETITIIVGSYPDRIPVWWLLLGATFDGLCGSFSASMALCYSYAADCTPPERRNVAFGYFHGTLFVGIAFGPVLAGYLISWTDNILIIFYVALGCHTFFILFLNIFIPESLSLERQRHAREKHQTKMLDPDYSSWRSIATNYNFFEPLSILWPRGPGSSGAIRRNMLFLATIDTLCFGVAMGTMNIIIIYAQFVFGWSGFESSAFLSATNICRVGALVVILPAVTRFVRGRAGSQPASHEGADKLDLYLIRFSIVFDLFGYIGYASAKTGAVMVISGMIASFGGIASPTLQATLTKHVPTDRTGQLLGATGLLHALARVVAPTIFNLIYAKTVSQLPQTVFICLASVFVLAELLSWCLKPNVYLPSDYQPPHIEPEHRDRRFLVHKASSALFDGIRRMSAGASTRQNL